MSDLAPSSLPSMPNSVIGPGTGARAWDGAPERAWDSNHMADGAWDGTEYCTPTAARAWDSAPLPTPIIGGISQT